VSAGKETLLGAALHYNDDLKKEVEDWLRAIVQQELLKFNNFERDHINNFPTFKRLIREATRQDLDQMRNNSY